MNGYSPGSFVDHTNRFDQLFRAIPYSRLKEWYTASPLWLQRTYAAIPFPLRAGAIFRKTTKEIQATEFLTPERLQQLQEARLNLLLKHARKHVPYYKSAWERLSLGARSAGAFEALSELPLVEKADLRANREVFECEGQLREASYSDNTGGSTGSPLTFLKCNSMYPIEQAHIMSLWRRIGYRPGDRKLTLRGRTFAGRRPDQRWQFNPIYNEVVLSSYHLDAETLAESLHSGIQFCPRFIHGYPSAIVTMLKVAKEHDLPLPEGVVAVLCGSEPLYEFQRRFIEETLNCRAYSWYGQSECVLLAGECEESSDYHSCPLYGVLELVDEAGTSIRTPGIEGEIVGTSLNNFAMPFIRYKTGDRGVLAEGVTCRCGRSHVRLKRVTGRKQHFIYTETMRAVPVTAFVFGQHFAAFARMQGMQLEQTQPGQLLIRVVRDADYTELDELELRKRMEESVDGQVAVKVEYVEHLPLNAAGKVDFVIQRVKSEELIYAT